MPKKLTTEDFIERAKAIHGDKYNYSKTEYVNKSTKVCITCPVHGDFWQTPHAHTVKNSGCPKCGNSLKKTTEEFIKDAREKHGSKYDYRKVEYVDANNYVLIICPEHGEFKQTPHKHLCGRGCPKCANMKRAQGRALSHEEHVATIAKVNPDVEILEMIANATTPVLCRSRICGHEWRATPHDLKNGHSCPKCADYGFLAHNYGNLYIMVDDLEASTLMKVGVSINVEKRRDNVLNSAKRAGAGIPNLYVIKTWYGATENMQALEKAMHQTLIQYRINFPVKFEGSTEFFYYRPEVFELIEEHLKKFSTEE